MVQKSLHKVYKKALFRVKRTRNPETVFPGTKSPINFFEMDLVNREKMGSSDIRKFNLLMKNIIFKRCNRR